MPSFISSSNDRLPSGDWAVIWTSIVILLALTVLVCEVILRQAGWTSSIIDSRELWAYHRERASKEGKNAFILVGASRIQLGIDLDEIRKLTNMVPIQLAINGNSFMPVLADLANDPDISGTIIIEANEQGIKPHITRDVSDEYVEYYHAVTRENKHLEPYKAIDDRVRSYLDNHMVTRLYGATPFTVISGLLYRKLTAGNYLSIDAERSISADYTKVRLPEFYASRVRSNFGSDLVETNSSYEQFIAVYEKAIDKLDAINNRDYISAVSQIVGYIHAIENRGGKVILVRFPTGKLIWAMDKKSYPRIDFWEKLRELHRQAIHFEDYPELSGFNLPDGSHLDFRDKKQFTKSLIEIISHNTR